MQSIRKGKSWRSQALKETVQEILFLVVHNSEVCIRDLRTPFPWKRSKANSSELIGFAMEENIRN